MEHSASIEDIGYFLNKYGRNRNLKLLDIGCSDGKKVLKFIDQEGFKDIEYTGLDSVYWNEIIGSRPLLNKGKNFIYGEACNLPFKDEKFDLIILSHVFEHIKDSGKLCSEIIRVTKKESKILVIIPIEKGGFVGFINKNRNLWKYLRIFFDYLKILSYKQISPHLHFMSYQEYFVFFQKRFKIIENYGRGSFCMLLVSLLHENIMGFGRQKINLMEIIKNNFPNFFRNTYRKNKNFKINAVFILEPKK